MARKKLNPVERIKLRHERRLKHLAGRKKALETYYNEELAGIDLELVETRAVLAQLAK